MQQCDKSCLLYILCVDRIESVRMLDLTTSNTVMAPDVTATAPNMAITIGGKDKDGKSCKTVLFILTQVRLCARCCGSRSVLVGAEPTLQVHVTADFTCCGVAWRGVGW